VGKRDKPARRKQRRGKTKEQVRDTQAANVGERERHGLEEEKERELCTACACASHA
jgi:hypothetical protein